MLRRLRHLRTVPLAFLIIILAFQTAPAFAGLNLCIGVDGHLEIESQDAGCCPSPHAVETGLSLAKEGDACASCIDVSLGDHAASTLANPASPAVQVFLPPPVLLERLKILRLSASSSQERGVPDYPSLMAIRSVVLRV